MKRAWPRPALSVTQVRLLDVWYAKGGRNKFPKCDDMAFRYKVDRRTILNAVKRRGIYARVPKPVPRDMIAG